MKRLKTLKNQKPLAVDVLFRAYPMVPLSCVSNLARRYLLGVGKYYRTANLYILPTRFYYAYVFHKNLHKCSHKSQESMYHFAVYVGARAFTGVVVEDDCLDECPS